MCVHVHGCVCGKFKLKHKIIGMIYYWFLKSKQERSITLFYVYASFAKPVCMNIGKMAQKLKE